MKQTLPEVLARGAGSSRLASVALLVALALAPGAGVLGLSTDLRAQAATKKDDAGDSKKKDADEKPPKIPDAPLFKKESLLEATLTANFKDVRKDKGEEAEWHAATISYADSSVSGGVRTVPVRVRTRGIWRLKNCVFPPLRLNFANKDIKGSIWHDLDEPKLVTYCRSTNMHEQYVLQELQLYRIYRLLTPASHRVRLLRMSFADSATKKVESTHFAFIVEDPQHVAISNGGKLLKAKGASPEDLDPQAATLAYMFQYMIGNTDFSVSGLHNAELIARADGINLPIAYDFDFSGAVNAVYAAPDKSLPINAVRTRLYRGFCGQNADVPRVIPIFLEKKEAIYALYRDEIGALMTPKLVKETLEYFDDFYKTITTPKDLERHIYKECRKPQ